MNWTEHVDNLHATPGEEEIRQKGKEPGGGGGASTGF